MHRRLRQPLLQPVRGYRESVSLRRSVPLAGMWRLPPLLHGQLGDRAVVRVRLVVRRDGAGRPRHLPVARRGSFALDDRVSSLVRRQAASRRSETRRARSVDLDDLPDRAVVGHQADQRHRRCCGGRTRPAGALGGAVLVRCIAARDRSCPMTFWSAPTRGCRPTPAGHLLPSPAKRRLFVMDAMAPVTPDNATLRPWRQHGDIREGARTRNQNRSWHGIRSGPWCSRKVDPGRAGPSRDRWRVAPAATRGQDVTAR